MQQFLVCGGYVGILPESLVEIEQRMPKPQPASQTNISWISVTVIGVENGIGDPSSNPEQGFLFALLLFEK